VAVLFGFDSETPRPLFGDWQSAIFVDDVHKLRSAIEVATERGGPYYVEFRVTHPDGSTHWIAGKGIADSHFVLRTAQVLAVLRGY
jgi:hypothetical protein